MKKVILVFCSLLSVLYIVTGCESKSPKIIEEEAESIVIERHSGRTSEFKIISVSHNRGEYIVKWEIDRRL